MTGISAFTRINTNLQTGRIHLDTAPNAMLAIRASDGLILHANAKTEDLLGYSEGVLDGKNIQSVISTPIFMDHMFSNQTMSIINSDGISFDINALISDRRDNRDFRSIIISLNPLFEAYSNEPLHYSDELNLLDHLSKELIGFSDSANIYEYIGEKVLSLIGGHAQVIVQKVDGDYFIPQHIAGIGSKMKWLISNLGFNPVNAKFLMDHDMELSGLRRGELILFNGGLHEATSKKIPKPVAKIIEQVLNIGDIYGIGLVAKDVLFGMVAIHMNKGKKLQNAKITNTFINLAGVKLNSISEKEKSIEALKQSEERYTRIVNFFPGGIAAIDLNGQLLSRNIAIMKIFGYSSETIPDNVNIFEYFLPEDIPVIKDRMKTIVEFKQDSANEYQVFDKDHNRKWVRIHSAPEIDKDGNACVIIVSLTDITEIKQMEESLKESLEKFKIAFENIPLSINLNRVEDGVYVDINGGFTKLSGYTREETIGRSSIKMNIWANPSDRELLVKGLREKGYVEDLRSDFMTKYGKKTCLMSASIMKIKGVSHILSVTTDITEKIKHEKALVEAMDAALESARSKTSFLAIVSHELRTPLNPIQGYSGFLLNQANEVISKLVKIRDKVVLLHLEEEFDEDIMDLKIIFEDNIVCLNIILESTQGLLKIINNILEYAQLPASSAGIVKSDFPIREEVDHLIRHYEHEAKMLGLKIFYNISDNIPDSINGSWPNISKILSSIIENAIKYSDRSKINSSIKISVEKVFDKSTGGAIRFTVADEGVGIAEKDVQKIFEPFTQLEEFNIREHGGIGMGLSIAKRLADIMGGKIDVYSKIGVGSSFVIELPFEGLIEDIKKVEDQMNILPSLKILHVEDDPGNQLIMMKTLKRLGVSDDHLSVAKNGKEGLDMYKNGTYDVILMDINMPIMDGLEATKEIRAFETERGINKVIIIASTARVGSAFDDVYMASGIDVFLSKPHDSDTIKNTIEACFKKEEQK